MSVFEEKLEGSLLDARPRAAYGLRSEPATKAVEESADATKLVVRLILLEDCKYLSSKSIVE